MKRTGFCRAILAISIIACVCGAAIVEAQTKMPGGVTSRVKKINAYLDATESRLKSGSVDRNDLERAQEALGEIQKSYKDFASHAEVKAAEKRIAKVSEAIKAVEASKKQAKDKKEKDTASSEKILVDWANRLTEYKTNTSPGTKGYFGVSTEDIEKLLATKKDYENAKALYAEFLKTGINKDDHFKLRQAEYDIKVAILNYEQSRDRIPEAANKEIDEALKWMAETKASGKKLSLSKHQHERIALLIENVNKVFPNTDKARALNAKKADLDKKIEEADKSILEGRRMKPNQYSGKDAEELKKMAGGIVTKNNRGAAVLKVNITSSSWETESALEWTDTTRSALQHRVTSFVYAQVGAKIGAECYLFTVYLNKDTIGGRQNPLTGHVMYKDRILEKNIK